MAQFSNAASAWLEVCLLWKLKLSSQHPSCHKVCCAHQNIFNKLKLTEFLADMLNLVRAAQQLLQASLNGYPLRQESVLKYCTLQAAWCMKSTSQRCIDS